MFDFFGANMVFAPQFFNEDVEPDDLADFHNITVKLPIALSYFPCSRMISFRLYSLTELTDILRRLSISSRITFH